MQDRKVLIVIPAFNESGRVAGVVAELIRRFPAYTVLVVDDASKDLTAAEAAGAGALVVSLAFNLGIGGAVQTGFIYAAEHGFDAVIQVDADGQHDPSSIADILAPVLNGSLDMCVGSRFTEGAQGFRSSFLRRLGIRFFCYLIGGLTGQMLTDPTSGFRACGKKLIRVFAANYPIDFPEPEAIVIAKRHKARIGEVPALMHARKGGVSSIRYLKSAYYMVKVTLAIVLCVLSKPKKGEGV